jgi:hypothetical protein
MFAINQTVTVKFACRTEPGTIVSRRGRTGYNVRIPWSSTRQDFATGKVITTPGFRTVYFRNADISATDATAQPAAV